MARCNCANPNGMDNPLVTGCGLTGDGTPERPLIPAVTATWPFPGDPATTAGHVYCVGGTLRTGPVPTIKTARALYTQQINRTLTGTLTTLSTLSSPLTNPDTNRSAWGFAHELVWVRLQLPINGVAQFFLENTEILGDVNTGSSANNVVSLNYSMVTPFGLGPGGTLLPGTSTLKAAGLNGAVVTHVRHLLDIYMWSNPTA